jgi:hypothetical protein
MNATKCRERLKATPENQSRFAVEAAKIRSRTASHLEWSTRQMDGREVSRRLRLHRRALVLSSRPARKIGCLSCQCSARRGCPRSVPRDVWFWWWHDRPDPQQIMVSWTRCHLGGARPWIHCPCGRRVARLFKGLTTYNCRQCFDNPRYASQSKSTQGRQHFEACKLRLRLGGIASLTAPFPERPRGMHRKTYERLRRRAEELEYRISPRLRDKPTDYPSLVYYLPPQTSKRFRR